PVMVTDYISDVASGYHDGDDFRRFNVRCTLAVPLLQDGAVTGAIYAAKSDPVPFDPTTIRLLERVAIFAQIALRNAHHVAYVEEESSRLRGILDTVQESVMVFDRDGRVVAVNDALERELRVRVPLAGVRYDDLGRDRDRYFGRGIIPMRPFDETMRQVLETGDPLQGIVELTDPDRTYDARVAPLRVGDEVTGIVVTLRDISPAIEVGRARSRAQVLDQLLQLSAILNSQLSIAALLDHVVEAAVGLVGARAGTLGLLEDNKLIFRRWLHDGVWDDIDLLLAQGEGISGVVWATGKPYITNDSSGDPHTIADVRAWMDIERALVVPLIDRSGRFLGTIQVHNPAGGDNFDEADVEALQLLAHQAAIALENAHLGQLKDEFLSVASHELKTPVTSIKGFTQVLQRRLPEELTGTFGRYLDIVDHQANRLTDLINSLLDVSRIQRGRFTFDMETLDYGQLVREVVTELRVVSPHNEITLEAPEEIFVRGNANRLRQVLVNLIDNAVKYGPRGGTIRVTVKPRDGEVATFVCDEGQGLPTEERDRIFSPYYQIPHSAGPSNGLGLGLFITRQIISEHGGSVWLDDVDHTSFCFTTPAAP
ncbi:MAG TPA: GAF domain-containing protein, partial [Chloroflexota bacterium]|nr:GAF domain-containing protein [Chloroflexota bacterium]